MDPAVGTAGNEVLLDDQLDGISDRLQQAERPYTVGADAVLEPGRHLALQPDHVRHDAGKDAEEAHQQPEHPANECCRVKLDKLLLSPERQTRAEGIPCQTHLKTPLAQA